MKKIFCLLMCALMFSAFRVPARADSLRFMLDQTDLIIDAARAQYEAGDRTPEFPPIPYRMLWIGYTRAVYDRLDFRMTRFDREYLQAVTLNFEKYVERRPITALTSSLTCFLSTERFR